MRYNTGMELPREPSRSPSSQPPEPSPSDPADLAESARGWHQIQLAALGFIGLCGLLWASGDAGGPGWLHWVAAGLALVALVLALLATYLVGRVAFPFYGHTGAATPWRGTGRLRTGIRLTYLAVAFVVIGTLVAWWPNQAEAGAVEVSDAAGRSWCGELADGWGGTLRLDTADGPISLPLTEIATLRPVDDCG